jgi:hypothetical protein
MANSTRIGLRWAIFFLTLAPTYFLGLRFGAGVIVGATGLQALNEVRVGWLLQRPPGVREEAR